MADTSRRRSSVRPAQRSYIPAASPSYAYEAAPPISSSNSPYSSGIPSLRSSTVTHSSAGLAAPPTALSPKIIQNVGPSNLKLPSTGSANGRRYNATISGSIGTLPHSTSAVDPMIRHPYAAAAPTPVSTSGRPTATSQEWRATTNPSKLPTASSATRRASQSISGTGAATGISSSSGIPLPSSASSRSRTATVSKPPTTGSGVVVGGSGRTERPTVRIDHPYASAAQIASSSRPPTTAASTPHYTPASLLPPSTSIPSSSQQQAHFPSLPSPTTTKHSTSTRQHSVYGNIPPSPTTPTSAQGPSSNRFFGSKRSHVGPNASKVSLGAVTTASTASGPQDSKRQSKSSLSFKNLRIALKSASRTNSFSGGDGAEDARSTQRYAPTSAVNSTGQSQQRESRTRASSDSAYAGVPRPGESIPPVPRLNYVPAPSTAAPHPPIAGTSTASQKRPPSKSASSAVPPQPPPLTTAPSYRSAHKLTPPRPVRPRRSTLESFASRWKGQAPVYDEEGDSIYADVPSSVANVAVEDLTYGPAQYAASRGLQDHDGLDMETRSNTHGSITFVNFGRHSPRRILDLGCGNGSWAFAAAKRWPRAHIVAIDDHNAIPRAERLNFSSSSSSSDDSESETGLTGHHGVYAQGSSMGPYSGIVSRVQFVQWSFLKDLPLNDGEIDFVHITNVAPRIPEDMWNTFFSNVRRVMSSRAVIEMVEDDLHFPLQHSQQELNDIYDDMFAARFVNLRPCRLIPSVMSTWFEGLRVVEFDDTTSDGAPPWNVKHVSGSVLQTPYAVSAPQDVATQEPVAVTRRGSTKHRRDQSDGSGTSFISRFFGGGGSGGKIIDPQRHQRAGSASASTLHPATAATQYISPDPRQMYQPAPYYLPQSYSGIGGSSSSRAPSFDSRSQNSSSVSSGRFAPPAELVVHAPPRRRSAVDALTNSGHNSSKTKDSTDRAALAMYHLRQFTFVVANGPAMRSWWARRGGERSQFDRLWRQFILEVARRRKEGNTTAGMTSFPPERPIIPSRPPAHLTSESGYTSLYSSRSASHALERPLKRMTRVFVARMPSPSRR